MQESTISRLEDQIKKLKEYEVLEPNGEEKAVKKIEPEWIELEEKTKDVDLTEKIDKDNPKIKMIE